MRESAAPKGSLPASPMAGFVGRIPVRSLWLLMFYASAFWRRRGTRDVSVEDNPDDLPDLIAEVLASAVERRLRRLLRRGYRRCAETLPRVRGRIDVLETERRQLLERGLVACRFEEMTVDTRRNRLVRAACEQIAGLTKKTELRKRCQRAARAMRAMGVGAPAPTEREMSTEVMSRHESDDREMVSAASLALDLAIPTEHAGGKHLPAPDREENRVRRLFEQAVRGFYTVTLEPQGWNVGSRKLGWQVEASTPGAKAILPGMQTDIMLEQANTGRRIIVDTKFTGILGQGQFGQDTLKSGYLFQIYSYVFSQIRSDDPISDSTEGVLIHPSVGKRVDEAVVIQGHRFRFFTVDLAADSKSIRAELLRVIGPPTQ